MPVSEYLLSQAQRQTVRGTTPTFCALGHKFQPCFSNALGLECPKLSWMRDPVYFGIDETRRSFSRRVSTPCDAQGSCQRTGPILDGVVSIYPALPCPGAGFFPKRREGVWPRGHPGPVHPSSPRASRPIPRGFGRNSGQAPAPRKFQMDSNPRRRLLRAAHAPGKVVRTPVWQRLCGARAATGERHRGRRAGLGWGRRDRGPGRRGGRRRGAAPRPGAPLKTTAERCGLAFPLPAGRGRDGTSALAAAASSARRPPGSAPRSALPCAHLSPAFPRLPAFPARERRHRGGRCRPWMPFLPLSGPAACPGRFAPGPARPRRPPLPWASTAGPTRASTPWAAWRGPSPAPTSATRWAPTSWAAAAAAAAAPHTPTRPTTTRRPTAGITPPTDTGRCGSSRPRSLAGRFPRCELATFFILLFPEAS